MSKPSSVGLLRRKTLSFLNTSNELIQDQYAAILELVKNAFKLWKERAHANAKSRGKTI